MIYSGLDSKEIDRVLLTTRQAINPCFKHEVCLFYFFFSASHHLRLLFSYFVCLSLHINLLYRCIANIHTTSTSASVSPHFLLSFLCHLTYSLVHSPVVKLRHNSIPFIFVSYLLAVFEIIFVKPLWLRSACD